MIPPPPLPPSLQRRFATRPTEAFAAGTSLLDPDVVPSHVWWLHTGLVRIYSLDAQGDAYNHAFAGEGEWVFGRLVLRGEAVCCADRAIGVAALQPTVATRVALAELERWRAEDAAVATHLLEVLLRATASGFAREADLVQRSAEARYRELVAREPELLRRVPLAQIAAWLGITPVALSRIRRRVAAASPPSN